MRTTLNLDDDVLAAAQEIARRERKTAGQVISELVRGALTGSPPSEAVTEPVLGFRPFPSRGVIVTNDVVDRLREEGEY